MRSCEASGPLTVKIKHHFTPESAKESISSLTRVPLLSVCGAGKACSTNGPLVLINRCAHKACPFVHPVPNSFWGRKQEEEEEVWSLLAAEAGEDLWQMGPSHKTHSLRRNSSPRTFHGVLRFTWSERCRRVCVCVWVCVELQNL